MIVANFEYKLFTLKGWYSALAYLHTVQCTLKLHCLMYKCTLYIHSSISEIHTNMYRKAVRAVLVPWNVELLIT